MECIQSDFLREKWWWSRIKMKRLRRWSNKPKATQLLCCVRRNARCLFYEKFHTAREVFLIVILMMFPVMLIWYFFSSRICVCGLCGEKIITIIILSISIPAMKNVVSIYKCINSVRHTSSLNFFVVFKKINFSCI